MTLSLFNNMYQLCHPIRLKICKNKYGIEASKQNLYFICFCYMYYLQRPWAAFFIVMAFSSSRDLLVSVSACLLPEV